MKNKIDQRERNHAYTYLLHAMTTHFSANPDTPADDQQLIDAYHAYPGSDVLSISDDKLLKVYLNPIVRELTYYSIIRIDQRIRSRRLFLRRNSSGMKTIDPKIVFEEFIHYVVFDIFALQQNIYQILMDAPSTYNTQMVYPGSSQRMIMAAYTKMLGIKFIPLMRSYRTIYWKMVRRALLRLHRSNAISRIDNHNNPYWKIYVHDPSI